MDLCSPECSAVNIGRKAIKKMLFGNDSATYQVFGTESSFTKFQNSREKITYPKVGQF